jgi:hypothetical protein
MLSDKAKSLLSGDSDSNRSFPAQPFQARYRSFIAYSRERARYRLLQVRILGAFGSFN